MVFALETQHGKPYQWGVRIEEMLIVHKDSVEIVSNFPVEQITVVDPMPGYSDYGKLPGHVGTGIPACVRFLANPMQPFVVPLTAPEAADAARFGPKAANLARLGQAGLPIPGGFCLDAEAYRTQIRALGLEADARGVFSAAESPQARRHALAMKLGLLDQPITPAVLDPLLAAWHDAEGARPAPSPSCARPRWSKTVSDPASPANSKASSESKAKPISSPPIRSCWGALWATRALRYMATHDIDPADTAMGVLVQPLVQARASGGGLSQSADGHMILSATWGLGSAIAQGEVTPDRYELSRDGKLLHVTPGRKDHQVGCIHRAEPMPQVVQRALIAEPCLNRSTGRRTRPALAPRRRPDGHAGRNRVGHGRCADSNCSRPARCTSSRPPRPMQSGCNRPRLNGHAAGIGWGTGRACVIHCECELSRVAPGDILVTKVAGPALSHILTRSPAWSPSAAAALPTWLRSRGNAEFRWCWECSTPPSAFPTARTVAVDGVAGVVRWMS